MDNFKAVYKILSTLEKAMDLPEFDMSLIGPDELRITLKGLEYLQENSLMKKMYNLAKGIKEVTPML